PALHRLPHARGRSARRRADGRDRRRLAPPRAGPQVRRCARADGGRGGAGWDGYRASRLSVRPVTSMPVDDLGTGNLRRIEHTVEERLRELSAGGELNGLPGEGAPLPPDPDADAGAAWAARHIARTAQLRPVWADLRQELADRRARLLRRQRSHLAWVERRQELLGRLPAERIASEF